MPNFSIVLGKVLTLIQPGKGRFTLAYMSLDYLDAVLTWLPGWIRVKEFLHFWLFDKSDDCFTYSIFHDSYQINM